MALLGVPGELLASCSSHSTSAVSPSSGNSTLSSASSSRISLAQCRGEVCGNPVLLRRRRSSRNRGDDVSVRTGWRRLKISAIDAAQEFDYESVKLTELQRKHKLRVGIVGFGNFGQFLAQRFVKQGHDVLAHSRSDHADVARKLGVTYYRDADDFCEEHPEVVVLCTSILSTEAVLQSLPLQRLKRNTLFVDVLSVKEFPRNLFLQALPTEFDVLCTHPMFGPESGRGSWQALPFVFEKVRVREGLRNEKCNRFLHIFESEGCRMVEMSCTEHDRHAAGSQFITHTVGRVLGSLGLESTPINTKGYESLLKLVENTYSDSFDLYYGLFLYNVNATEEVCYCVSIMDFNAVTAELVRLERAFDVVKSQLFDKLHGILRDQLLKSSNPSEVNVPAPPAPTMKALVAKPAEQLVDLKGLSSSSGDNGTSSAMQEVTSTNVQAQTVSDSH